MNCKTGFVSNRDSIVILSVETVTFIKSFTVTLMSLNFFIPGGVSKVTKIGSYYSTKKVTSFSSNRIVLTKLSNPGKQIAYETF